MTCWWARRASRYVRTTARRSDDVIVDGAAMHEDANLDAVLGCSRCPTAPGGAQEDSTMAAVCEICGKKPSFGMNLSHSHRRTKRRWDPNIQRVRALVDGSPKRISVC